MKQDKAIFKAVHSRKSPILSAGFNSRMMDQIYHAEAKRKKRSYILSLSSIAVASLGLISLAAYLLKDHIPLNVTLQFPAFLSLNEFISRYGFSFYIGFLILLLMIIDTTFRTFRHKRESDKFRQFK